MSRRIAASLVVLSMAFSGFAAGNRTPAALPQDTIAGFDELITRLMKEQDVPGLAVAVTDGEHTLWSKGYGWTDYDRRKPITPQTMFSIQSMSKTFTATAVMMACQEGLVDLDTPITTYLPEFTVNSAFEAHPESRITLRRLLSHTAGFAHEAPYGNSFSLGEMDFDMHVKSISSSWLRFPVGKNWAYSNLGIDLAGYIIQRRSGIPFTQYVQKKLLAPLGMSRTTMDSAAIKAEPDRAIGHTPFYAKLPVDIPMIPAGGVYTSAEDLVKFVRLHLNGGGGIIDAARLREMYTLPADGLSGNYGLGIVKNLISLPGHVTSWGLGHSGAGFGFLSDMYWYPLIGIGAVVLTNSVNHTLQGDLVFKILNTIIDDPRTVFHERLQDLPGNDPDTLIPPKDVAKALVTDNALRLLLLDRPAAAKELQRYIGDYKMRQLGLAQGPLKVRAMSASLTLNGEGLYQTAPGLFFTVGGEALDFRGDIPTWRDIPLAPIRVPLWQWVLWDIGPAVLAAGILAAPILILLRRRSGSAVPPGRGLWWAGAAGAFLNLAFAAALLLVIPRYSYFIGDGLPPVTPGIPLIETLLLRAPTAVFVVTCAMAGVCVCAWLRRVWSRPGRLYYSVLSGGAVVFVAAMVMWRIL